MHIFIIIAFAILGIIGSMPIMSLAAKPDDKPQFSTDHNQEELGYVKDGVRHVTSSEAATLLKMDATIKILDVRTRSEFNAGHIEGAVQINYYSLGFKRKIAALNKQVAWLVHCKSDHRSGRTVPIMKKTGFTSIIHLDGGFDAWKKAGLPLSTEE